MAKRKLSHQQSRRIKKAQQSIDLTHPDNLLGRVISHHGGEVEVEQEDKTQKNIHCKFRTNLGALVCGDQVIYRLNEIDPSIIAIQPRDNLLRRVDGFGNIKSVAANVTQLLICLSVEPEPNLFLLDQYLLSAEQQHIEVLIILNKVDLLPEDYSDPFELSSIYQNIGYQILYTSMKTQQQIDTLQLHCVDYVNVISGVSGVGKSSLTNAILPDIKIQVGEISEVSKEGRHTTRTSRLYHLPKGGELIDTPGVRGFNPVFDPEKTIASGFREINEYAQECQFSNCKHINEPKCAVLSSLKSGVIHQSRYDSYVKLFMENKSSSPR